MLDKIKNAPLLLFLLIGVAIAAMNYMGDISSLETLQNNKSNLNSQLNEKKDNLKKAKNASFEVPNIKAEIEQLTQVFVKASDIAPKTLTARDVIDTVTKEARFAGIRITQSRPANTAKAFGGNVSKVSTEEVGLELEIEGSYSQITFFFYQLSKAKIVLLPKEFEIAVKEILDNQVNLRVKGTLAGIKYLGGT